MGFAGMLLAKPKALNCLVLLQQARPMNLSWRLLCVFHTIYHKTEGVQNGVRGCEDELPCISHKYI